MVKAVAPCVGQRVLDVATGTGLVAAELVRSAGCDVVALDQSEEMLAGARSRLARNPALASRVTLVKGEAEHLPFCNDEFDALTFTYLLRYIDEPAATMRELVRVVKPGGRVGMVEFGVPSNGSLRAAWRLYTRGVMPALGRLVSPAWAEVGRFLGPNIEQFHANEPDLPALWRSAGLGEVGQRRLSFGAGLVMWGEKNGDARRG
jgi:demethylmenaquinone methyltransferase/2-methoxy-6-polyprenyl-1,4-benzoquinol methylase